MNDDGEVTRGFDVLLDNGSHLEFTISQVGRLQTDAGTLL